MKKLIAFTLALSLSFALVGCTGGSPASEPKSTPPTFDTSSSAAGEATEMPTTYFGKVNSVAGNEIELNLAKEPELPDVPQEETPKPNPDGSIDATIMGPATEAGGGGAAQRVEVEYTGEMKSFVVPGGMKIKDAMGNEKQLSDIKKGSVMNFCVDGAGNLVEVFLYE